MREIVITTWAVVMTAWSIACLRRFRRADREANQLAARLAAIGRERMERHKRQSEAAVRGAKTRREFARQADAMARIAGMEADRGTH